MTPGLIVLLLGIAFTMGIIFGPGIRRHRSRGTGDGPEIVELERERIKARDRAEARAMVERLAEKRLEVIKDAITMGYGDAQLDRLDARLEKLVGPEKLQELLNETGEAHLLDADLPPEGEAGRSKTGGLEAD